MRERPTARQMVELGRRHIADQRQRIERQRTLVETLDRDGHGEAVVRNAREHLGEMLKMLESMLSTQRAAVERAEQAVGDRNAALPERLQRRRGN